MRSRLVRLVGGSAAAFLFAASVLVTLAPASDATMVSKPITCDVPGTSGVHLVAKIAIMAPASVLTGHTYHVNLRTAMSGFNPTPIAVTAFSVTPNYTISGPVTPNGPLSFTQTPVDYPAGSAAAFTTFVQNFTASGPAGGVITYSLSSIDYVFSLSPGSPISVHCTLDGGPVLVTQTTVRTVAPSFMRSMITLPGRIGMPVMHLFHAQGTPAPEYSVGSGQLPPGLQLNKDGSLVGTPTQTGTYSFTVTATNGTAPDASLPVTMTIKPAMVG